MHNHFYHHDEAFQLDPILDPGSAGAIPANRSGICNLVTGGAETRTLANPTAQGVELTLTMLTDGGDCVITTAAGHNTSNQTTLTFNAVLDTAVLRSVKTTAGYQWRTVGLDGAASS